ncbi:unnamed protein product [Caretta caretta]
MEADEKAAFPPSSLLPFLHELPPWHSGTCTKEMRKTPFATACQYPEPTAEKISEKDFVRGRELKRYLYDGRYGQEKQGWMKETLDHLPGLNSTG